MHSSSKLTYCTYQCAHISDVRSNTIVSLHEHICSTVSYHSTTLAKKLYIKVKRNSLLNVFKQPFNR